MKTSHQLQNSVAAPGTEPGLAGQQYISHLSPSKAPCRPGELSLEPSRYVSLLETVIESATDGILVLDASGRIISYNTKFAALWGYPKEMLERLDKSELVAFAAEKVKNPKAFVARTQASGFMPETEAIDTIETKDGRVIERRVLPQKIGGERLGVVVSFHDATKVRESERELRDAQALYHSLVDQMPCGVFRKDAEGRYSYVNAEFCRITGLTADQLLGETSFGLVECMRAARGKECPVTDKVGAQGSAHHEAIMKTGAVIEVDEEHTQPSGKSRFHHAFKSPVFGFDGKIVGTQGILFDVTERVRAGSERDAERDLLRFLLENSEDRIYFKDRESRFLKCSPKQAEMFGCKHPDEALGKTDFDFFDEEHAKPAFRDEQEIIRTGKPMVGKVEKEVSKDGHVTWALTTKMPLRNKAGEIFGTFGISKDFTPLKDAQDKLEQAHSQLVEASRTAGMAEVATGVLHNVGNVLNSVNVSANLLMDRLRKSKTASVGRVAALLKEHGQDLGEFMTRDPKGQILPSFLENLAQHLAAEQVESLKELGELESNINHIKEIVAMQQSYAQVSGVSQAIKLVDLVEDALRINTSALTRHDVHVVREYDSDIPEMILDKHKVIQILINLVRNAKYACDESGMPDKHVIARVSKSPGWVKISIIDNGVGIPRENLTRIFNHGFTTRKNGHGFGLHSGALAAKKLGGTLLAQSDGPGKGAVFTLELPLQLPGLTS